MLLLFRILYKITILRNEIQILPPLEYAAKSCILQTEEFKFMPQSIVQGVSSTEINL